MTPQGLLAGRTAFITGAARGIGQAVAKAYVAEGARVAMADIDTAAVASAAAHLDPERTMAVGLDVTDEAATEAVAQKVEARLGTVDIVVANAGILHLQHAVDTPLDTWKRVLDVNLTGAFVTAKVFAGRMIAAAKPGQVIFTSSLFGLRGGRENASYSASKFGMIGLAQSMAAEVAGNGIRVNCVCPGQMQTDMIEQLFQDRAKIQGITVAAARDRLVSRIPTGHLGAMDDLAGTYVWLASPLSGYVTGQSIVVDGGWQVG